MSKSKEMNQNTQSEVAPKCQLVWEGTVLERNFGEVGRKFLLSKLNKWKLFLSAVRWYEKENYKIIIS